MKYAFVTVVVFLISAIWLFSAWSGGNKTNHWTPVPAQILSNDTQDSIRGRPAGWLTTIAYQFNGLQYETVVDEYLLGESATVYVDPNGPTMVVGKPGARMQDMGRPLIATVASGLFALVLILIAFSPKED